jgi:hypothetical protein
MSYLLKSGSLDNFSVRPAALPGVKAPVNDLLAKHKDLLSNIRNCSALEQMSRSLAEEKIPFVPEVLPVKGGLNLESITLYKGFEGLMNIFNPSNEIYFVAWTWDLSGNAPYVYPAGVDEAGKWFYPMKKGDTVKFVGDGICLFPQKEIAGGLGVHIEVWESDKDVRKAGETIKKITETVQKSDLSNVLTTLASINPATANLTLLKSAVEQLSGIIGNILKDNSDDYVNLFEGYYDVNSWTTGSEVCKNPLNNPVCEVVLNKI